MYARRRRRVVGERVGAAKDNNASLSCMPVYVRIRACVRVFRVGTNSPIIGSSREQRTPEGGTPGPAEEIYIYS